MEEEDGTLPVPAKEDEDWVGDGREFFLGFVGSVGEEKMAAFGKLFFRKNKKKWDKLISTDNLYFIKFSPRPNLSVFDIG